MGFLLFWVLFTSAYLELKSTKNEIFHLMKEEASTLMVSLEQDKEFDCILNETTKYLSACFTPLAGTEENAPLWVALFWDVTRQKTLNNGCGGRKSFRQWGSWRRAPVKLATGLLLLAGDLIFSQKFTQSLENKRKIE